MEPCRPGATTSTAASATGPSPRGTRRSSRVREGRRRDDSRANDWFLDLDPAIPKAIPPENVPVFLVVAGDRGGGRSPRASASAARTSARPEASSSSRWRRRHREGRGRRLAAVRGRQDACAVAARRRTPWPACWRSSIRSGQLQAVSASSLAGLRHGRALRAGTGRALIAGRATVNIGGRHLLRGLRHERQRDAQRRRQPQRGDGAGRHANASRRRRRPAGGGTPREGGRGFSIEAAGSNLFFATYLYDVSGRSTWHVAAGPTSLDGSALQSARPAELRRRRRRSPAPIAPPRRGRRARHAHLRRRAARHARVARRNGGDPALRLRRQRLNAAPPAPTSRRAAGGGATLRTTAAASSSSGRATRAFVAGYMYDDTGQPRVVPHRGADAGGGRRAVFVGQLVELRQRPDAHRGLETEHRSNRRLCRSRDDHGSRAAANGLMTLPNGRTRSPFTGIGSDAKNRTAIGASSLRRPGLRGGPFAAEPADPAGEVVSVEGKGECARGGADRHGAAATVRQRLFATNFVRTLDREQDCDRLHRPHAGRARRQQHAADQGSRQGPDAKTIVNLNRGAAGCSRRVAPHGLLMETPSAVAAIRGTDWEMVVDGRARDPFRVQRRGGVLERSRQRARGARGEQARAEKGRRRSSSRCRCRAIAGPVGFVGAGRPETLAPSARDARMTEAYDRLKRDAGAAVASPGRGRPAAARLSKIYRGDLAAARVAHRPGPRAVSVATSASTPRSRAPPCSRTRGARALAIARERRSRDAAIRSMRMARALRPDRLAGRARPALAADGHARCIAARRTRAAGAAGHRWRASATICGARGRI